MIKVVVNDSEELALQCKGSLDISRLTAMRFGREALEINKRGCYSAFGKSVKIVDNIYCANQEICSLMPDDELPGQGRERDSESTTYVEISNLTTLNAAKQLTASRRKVAVLNFADPITPGGGFLNGARAQEGSLCRSSTLYQSIRRDKMYAWHLNQTDSRLASNWCIWSPDVIVFRNEYGDLTERFWCISVITCAAPQAAYASRQQIRELMTSRIHRVFEVFRAKQATHLVLGAWGCGAFGCSPDDIAEIFATALTGPFDGVFDRIVFAIADWSEDRRILRPFERAFVDGNAGN
jgi:uncharacterized protein (TIGR02452 family)